MIRDSMWKTIGVCTRAVLEAAFISVVIPFAAQAKQPVEPTCNALVSLANDLFLVTETGKLVTQFTSDGTPKDSETISPDGSRVAYVNQDASNDSYRVVDIHGRQGMYSADDSTSISAGSDAENLDTVGPLVGLNWSSNSVLRLEKAVSPNVSQFEFHRINEDLTGSASTLGVPVYGTNCVRRRGDGPVGCVRDGDVTIDKMEVYFKSGFSGISPSASFTLTKGQSYTTSGDPGFKIAIIGFYKNTVGLRITLPNGVWQEPYVATDGSDFEKISWHDKSYGISATAISGNPNAVRIDIVKRTSQSNVFSPALAWQPRGHGLFLIEHTNTQTFLDLIQPGRGDVSDHLDKDHGPQWHLAAQTAISLPGKVHSIRFLTPSLLLLNIDSLRGPQFSLLPIHISNGLHSGKLLLTVGAITALPDTLPLTVNSTTVKAKVLGWSCADRHDDDD